MFRFIFMTNLSPFIFPPWSILATIKGWYNYAQKIWINFVYHFCLHFSLWTYKHYYHNKELVNLKWILLFLITMILLSFYVPLRNKSAWNDWKREIGKFSRNHIVGGREWIVRTYRLKMHVKEAESGSSRKRIVRHNLLIV